MMTGLVDLDRTFSAMDLFWSRINNLLTDYDRFYRDDYYDVWADSGNTPKTNIYNAEDHFEVKVKVPGVAKEDLNIKVLGNYLEISGTRKPETPEGYFAHRVERETLSFSRGFTLPADVNTEKVDASLKDGILTLTLAKAEAAKPKRITIT